MTPAIILLVLLAAILGSRAKKTGDPARAKLLLRVAMLAAGFALLIALVEILGLVNDHA